MASLISHAVAALGIGAVFARPQVPNRVWTLGAACSVIPDIDVIGFRFGIRYGDFWGHRGFTHSLVFAAILATAALTIGFFRETPGMSRVVLWLYFFLATASHGLLDAMTNGGLGVAFFSPFNNTRYFLPWRPILVSPISVTRFFSDRGIAVLQSELLWIWIPAGTLAALVFVIRIASRSHRRRQQNPAGIP
jgi:inner membrane protein